MPKIEITRVEDDEITVFIPGAKKTKRGKEGVETQRGIDRTVSLKLPKDELWLLVAAIETANSVGMHSDKENAVEKAIGAIQSRIQRAGVKLFGRKKQRFCLYSLRYTLGSNLKKQLNDRKTKNRDKIIAAVLGHRNTDSQSYYGNYSSGQLKGNLPTPSQETIKQVIRGKRRAFRPSKVKGRSHSPTTPQI